MPLRRTCPSNFVHDFRTGVPPESFDFDGDETTMKRLPEGVRMSRSTDAGVRAMRLCAMIDGDFDVVAGYRDLEISSGKPTWHCGVGIAFYLDNVTQDQCLISRRRDRMKGHHCVGFGQKETNAGGKTSWIGGSNVVDESTAGRLRLVRRGTKVYGLHAIGNSPSFRIVHETSVPLGRIAIHGLRFETEVGKGLDTSVTWTNLDIRAEKVDFLNVEDQVGTLAKLNELRKQKAAEIIDLTTQSLSDAGIYTGASDRAGVITNDQGATVTARGDDLPERFAMLKNVNLGADFDIQVDFKILRLDIGFQEQASSEVVLQVRLESAQDAEPDSDELQVVEASIILRHKWTGTLDLRPRVVARGRGGRTVYLPIRTIPVEMPDQYRIVQHDRTLYFMYSDERSPEPKIIATYPLDRDLTASAIHLSVIASRNQRITETSWKQLQFFGTPGQLQDVFRFIPIQILQP